MEDKIRTYKPIVRFLKFTFIKKILVEFKRFLSKLFPQSTCQDYVIQLLIFTLSYIVQARYVLSNRFSFYKNVGLTKH